jgi:hypothetical protein
MKGSLRPGADLLNVNHGSAFRSRRAVGHRLASRASGRMGSNSKPGTDAELRRVRISVCIPTGS